MIRMNRQPSLTRLCGLITCLFWPLAVIAEDWREFRGPSGQGTSDAQGVPVRWDRKANVQWERELKGTGWSSPVVSGDRIYLTTAVVQGEPNVTVDKKFSRKLDNAFSLRAMCLQAGSGETIWDVEIARVPPKASIHPKNSHASATPIVTDDRLYVHFGIYGTAALDLDGKRIWRKQIKFKPVHGGGGSPVLEQDALIFHCDGGDKAFLIALDKDSGEEKWRTKRSVEAERKFSFSTPLIITVGGQTTLVSSASDAVYGYDPESGKERWHVLHENKWSIVPRPVFADGLILACSGYEGPAELIAIRPGGTGDVSESHVVWRENRFVPYNPSPLVHEGKVFLVSDAGIASCRNLESGQLIWKQRLGGNYSASPFLCNEKVYFLSEEGVCTVIEASDSFKEVASNDVGERTLASMVPIDNGILLRTKTSLLRIGKANR